MTLDVGSIAPDFTLKNQHGEEVSLASFKDKKNVVVLFYPFAFSGVCTGELCGLRDDLGSFENDNVQLLAISTDPMWSLRAFSEKEGYKFPLLSDFYPHGDTAKKYGVFEESRGCAVRGTFIINKDGEIAWKIVNGLPDARNLNEYKAALATL